MSDKPKPTIDCDDVPACVAERVVDATKDTTKAVGSSTACTVTEANASSIESPDDVVASLLHTFKENMQLVQDKLKTNLGSVGKKNRKKKKEFYKLAEVEEETLKQTLAKELEPLGVNLADVLPGKDEVSDAAAAAAPQKKKKSKAQRRREKRRAEEKLRAQRIAEATRHAASTESAKDREIRLLEAKLAPLKHRIHEVPADGHCLFRALAHFLVDESKGRIPLTHQQLRQKAAAHMRRCSENFSPFFSVDSLPAGLDAKPKNFAEYLDALESTAMWGGEMELRALSNEFTRPIEVFKADNANLQMCRDKFPSAKPIRISFHRHYYTLGEHYNSVVPEK